jgi:hypothetical protein
MLKIGCEHNYPKDAVKRILGGDSKSTEFALKHRWLFIEHEAAERLGLFAAGAARNGGQS